MSILLAYASNHGQTERIARRIAAGLEGDGLAVEVQEIAKRGGGPAPNGHEAVVVSASIHVGKHQKQVVRWLQEHRATLGTMPTALVSVSLAATTDTDEGPVTARRCVDDLLAATGWTPDLVATIGGALRYREYGLLTRVLMRRIARRQGLPTDTSVDHDLTDWDAVDRFAGEVAAQLKAASV